MDDGKAAMVEAFAIDRDRPDTEATAGHVPAVAETAWYRQGRKRCWIDITRRVALSVETTEQIQGAIAGHRWTSSGDRETGRRPERA
ncbi:hypothetical protein ABIC44_000700 [Sphingomonas sp. 1185]